jgi:hypothetical protein
MPVVDHRHLGGGSHVKPYSSDSLFLEDIWVRRQWQYPQPMRSDA